MTYMHKPGFYHTSYEEVFYQDPKNPKNFNFQGFEWVNQDVEISLHIEAEVDINSELLPLNGYGSITFTDPDGALVSKRESYVTGSIGSFNFKTLCEVIKTVFKKDFENELIEYLDIPLIEEYLNYREM